MKDLVDKVDPAIITRVTEHIFEPGQPKGEVQRRAQSYIYAGVQALAIYGGAKDALVARIIARCLTAIGREFVKGAVEQETGQILGKEGSA